MYCHRNGQYLEVLIFIFLFGKFLCEIAGEVQPGIFTNKNVLFDEEDFFMDIDKRPLLKEVKNLSNDNDFSIAKDRLDVKIRSKVCYSGSPWVMAGKDSSICGFTPTKNKGKCLGKLNIRKAASICKQYSARLCTANEVLKGEVFDDGKYSPDLKLNDCGLNTRYIWTTTKCNKGRIGTHHYIAKGNGDDKKKACSRSDKKFHAKYVRCCYDMKNGGGGGSSSTYNLTVSVKVSESNVPEESIIENFSTAYKNSYPGKTGFEILVINNKNLNEYNVRFIIEDNDISFDILITDLKSELSSSRYELDKLVLDPCSRNDSDQCDDQGRKCKRESQCDDNFKVCECSSDLFGDPFCSNDFLSLKVPVYPFRIKTNEHIFKANYKTTPSKVNEEILIDIGLNDVLNNLCKDKTNQHYSKFCLKDFIECFENNHTMSLNLLNDNMLDVIFPNHPEPLSVDKFHLGTTASDGLKGTLMIPSKSKPLDDNKKFKPFSFSNNITGSFEGPTRSLDVNGFFYFDECLYSEKTVPKSSEPEIRDLPGFVSLFSSNGKTSGEINFPHENLRNEANYCSRFKLGSRIDISSISFKSSIFTNGIPTIIDNNEDSLDDKVLSTYGYSLSGNIDKSNDLIKAIVRFTSHIYTTLNKPLSISIKNDEVDDDFVPSCKTYFTIDNDSSSKKKHTNRYNGKYLSRDGLLEFEEDMNNNLRSCSFTFPSKANFGNDDLNAEKTVFYNISDSLDSRRRLLYNRNNKRLLRRRRSGSGRATKRRGRKRGRLLLENNQINPYVDDINNENFKSTMFMDSIQDESKITVETSNSFEEITSTLSFDENIETTNTSHTKTTGQGSYEMSSNSLNSTLLGRFDLIQNNNGEVNAKLLIPNFDSSQNVQIENTIMLQSGKTNDLEEELEFSTKATTTYNVENLNKNDWEQTIENIAIKHVKSDVEIDPISMVTGTFFKNKVDDDYVGNINFDISYNSEEEFLDIEKKRILNSKEMNYLNPRILRRRSGRSSGGSRTRRRGRKRGRLLPASFDLDNILLDRLDILKIENSIDNEFVFKVIQSNNELNSDHDEEEIESSVEIEIGDNDNRLRSRRMLRRRRRRGSGSSTKRRGRKRGRRVLSSIKNEIYKFDKDDDDSNNVLTLITESNGMSISSNLHGSTENIQTSLSSIDEETENEITSNAKGNYKVLSKNGDDGDDNDDLKDKGDGEFVMSQLNNGLVNTEMVIPSLANLKFKDSNKDIEVVQESNLTIMDFSKSKYTTLQSDLKFEISGKELAQERILNKRRLYQHRRSTSRSVNNDELDNIVADSLNSFNMNEEKFSVLVNTRSAESPGSEGKATIVNNIELVCTADGGKIGATTTPCVYPQTIQNKRYTSGCISMTEKKPFNYDSDSSKNLPKPSNGETSTLYWCPTVSNYSIKKNKWGYCNCVPSTNLSNETKIIRGANNFLSTRRRLRRSLLNFEKYEFLSNYPMTEAVEEGRFEITGSTKYDNGLVGVISTPTKTITSSDIEAISSMSLCLSPEDSSKCSRIENTFNTEISGTIQNGQKGRRLIKDLHENIQNRRNIRRRSLLPASFQINKQSGYTFQSVVNFLGITGENYNDDRKVDEFEYIGPLATTAQTKIKAIIKDTDSSNDIELINFKADQTDNDKLEGDVILSSVNGGTGATIDFEFAPLSSQRRRQLFRKEKRRRNLEFLKSDDSADVNAIIKIQNTIEIESNLPVGNSAIKTVEKIKISNDLDIPVGGDDETKINGFTLEFDSTNEKSIEVISELSQKNDQNFEFDVNVLFGPSEPFKFSANIKGSSGGLANLDSSNIGFKSDIKGDVSISVPLDKGNSATLAFEIDTNEETFKSEVLRADSKFENENADVLVTFSKPAGSIEVNKTVELRPTPAPTKFPTFAPIPKSPIKTCENICGKCENVYDCVENRESKINKFCKWESRMRQCVDTKIKCLVEDDCNYCYDLVDCANNPKCQIYNNGDEYGKPDKDYYDYYKDYSYYYQEQSGLQDSSKNLNEEGGYSSNQYYSDDFREWCAPKITREPEIEGRPRLCYDRYTAKTTIPDWIPSDICQRITSDQCRNSEFSTLCNDNIESDCQSKGWYLCPKECQNECNDDSIGGENFCDDISEDFCRLKTKNGCGFDHETGKDIGILCPKTCNNKPGIPLGQNFCKTCGDRSQNCYDLLMYYYYGTYFTSSIGPPRYTRLMGTYDFYKNPLGLSCENNENVRLACPYSCGLIKTPQNCENEILFKPFLNLKRPCKAKDIFNNKKENNNNGKCVFPFFVKQIDGSLKKYNTCTGYKDLKPFNNKNKDINNNPKTGLVCSTAHIYDSKDPDLKNSWGYCDCASQPINPEFDQVPLPQVCPTKPFTAWMKQQTFGNELSLGIRGLKPESGKPYSINSFPEMLPQYQGEPDERSIEEMLLHTTLHFIPHGSNNGACVYSIKVNAINIFIPPSTTFDYFFDENIYSNSTLQERYLGLDQKTTNPENGFEPKFDAVNNPGDIQKWRFSLPLSKYKPKPKYSSNSKSTSDQQWVSLSHSKEGFYPNSLPPLALNEQIIFKGSGENDLSNFPPTEIDVMNTDSFTNSPVDTNPGYFSRDCVSGEGSPNSACTVPLLSTWTFVNPGLFLITNNFKSRLDLSAKASFCNKNDLKSSDYCSCNAFECGAYGMIESIDFTGSNFVMDLGDFVVLEHLAWLGLKSLNLNGISINESMLEIPGIIDEETGLPCLPLPMCRLGKITCTLPKSRIICREKIAPIPDGSGNSEDKKHKYNINIFHSKIGL